MTQKESLYYLLAAYKQGKYDVPTFCSAFYNEYFPDIPKSNMSALEMECFAKLANVVSRFSEFEEDFIALPNAFYSQKDVISAIEMACSLLEIPPIN